MRAVAITVPEDGGSWWCVVAVTVELVSTVVGRR